MITENNLPHAGVRARTHVLCVSCEAPSRGDRHSSFTVTPQRRCNTPKTLPCKKHYRSGFGESFYAINTTIVIFAHAVNTTLLVATLMTIVFLAWVVVTRNKDYRNDRSGFGVAKMTIAKMTVW